jgi:hypothetical protein
MEDRMHRSRHYRKRRNRRTRVQIIHYRLDVWGWVFDQVEIGNARYKAERDFSRAMAILPRPSPK